MDITDDCIKEIRAWFRQREEAGQARHFHHIRAEDAVPQPPNPGHAEANPKIILKEDTQLELGHPSAGSCSATLATHDSSLIEDGRITLVGPDVGETQEKTLPFAQIALTCCDGNIEDTCTAMDRILYLKAQTDGYMLRSVPDMIWGRVSKDAARSGFSLEQLGIRLIDSLNRDCASASKSEILFVTSSRQDIDELNTIIEPTRTKLRKLQTFGRKDDGTYECDTSLDCDECPEQPVCDTIREVITIRKGDRIIRFGGDDDNE
jgi:CO dehydrogenase/acetyl-CoA synthase beta subunit